ncbi:hypothetical protein DFV88_24755 [Salmonella enterica subsp. enterica serovar Newport]|nr:hypothetical protein [Salmonella enterica subsp. enterica serovar Newport]
MNILKCESFKHFFLFNMVAYAVIRAASHTASVSYDKATVLTLVALVIALQGACIAVKYTYCRSLYQRGYTSGACLMGVLLAIGVLMLFRVLAQVGGLV